MAQAPAPARGDSNPFAGFVPPSAGLFLTIRQLDEMDAALQRSGALRLWPLLTGKTAPSDDSANLRQMIVEILGLPEDPPPSELLAGRIGIVAPSWQQLGDAIWFFELEESGALERWFPSERKSRARTTTGLRLFRAGNGLIVCQRDNVVALSRRVGTGSMLHQTIRLMARRDGESLAAEPAFQELTAYLPADPLAVAYLAPGSDKSGVLATGSLTGTVDRAVVGLFEGDGRIDLAIRALLVTAREQTRLTPRAALQMLQLPRTTLAAMVTTMNFERVFAPNRGATPTGILERYLLLLGAVLGVPEKDADSGPRLGPNLILAWGQDLRENADAPQAALLVECSNGTTMQERVTRGATDLIQLFTVLDPTHAREHLQIERTRHLTVPIEYLTLPAFARASSLPWASLLHNVEPAWTIWNGWLIVALSREHIEQILEAQFGLTPTLLTVSDVRAVHRSSYERSMLAVVQPGVAANVLNQWLKAYEAGRPSLLDPAWWSGSNNPDADRHRGLQIHHAPDSNAAVVAGVAPDSPAAGRLEPGDWILAVNGKLLPLQAPDAQLRRRLSTDESELRLRVRRGEQLLEVVVPAPRDDVFTRTRKQPAEALRELATLGAALQFATLEVNTTDPMHYSARLSLRFAPRGGAAASVGHGNDSKDSGAP